MEQNLQSFIRGYHDPVEVIGLDGEVWLCEIWYVSLRIKSRHDVPATSSQVVLRIHALFYPSTKWMDRTERLLKLSLLSLALEKVLNMRNFKAHLQHNVSAGFRVHLSQEPASLMHKWMMNTAVIRDSSFISTAIDTKVPESNKSNGLCNLRHGGLVSF